MLPRKILRSRVLRSTLRVFLVVLIPIVALVAPALYRDANRDDEVKAADVGAGEGQMAIPLAKRLGPKSQVFATEIDSSALRQLRESIAGAGLRNLTVVEGTPEQINLPGECCDAIIMSDVYYHFTDPVSMNASLFRALRPSGRLAVIDFAPSAWLFWLQRPSGVPEDRGGHGVQARLVTAELGRAGFVIERVVDDWWRFMPRRYCLIARKPDAQVRSR